jgi:ferric enterobactin receptor
VKKLYLFLFTSLICSNLWAQNAADLIIKDEYYNNVQLSKVIADLQKKFTVKIGYDSELIGNYRVSYWFQNKKLLDGLQEMLKKTKDLTYYVDEGNVIHIVAKENVKTTNLKKTFDSHYDGKPERNNFALSGKITDKNTGENLPFASVSVLGKKNGTQTNVDGYFTLLKVPSDTVTILVSYMGFKVARYFLSPKTSLSGLIIELEPDLQELGEVTVTGERTEVLQASETVSMIRMTPRNLTKLPNVGERDPFRAFQLMPGVSASNESSSGLYVRGGTPDQTLVLYDGFTVYHVDHLFGFFSAFNYNAIKDIQLYKGGFDARYGGRISAVAEITGKEGNKKQFNAGADASLLSVNGFIEAPIGKKISVLVAARRSYKGPLYTKIFNNFTSNQTTQNTGAQQGGRGQRGNFASSLLTQTAASYFYDLNAKVTFTPTKKDIVTLSLYNGTDNMDNSSTGGFGNFGRQQTQNVSITSTDAATWGNLGSSLKWSRQWSDKLYSNALVSYSNYYSNRDNSRSITLTQQDGTVRVQGLGSVESNTLEDFTAKINLEYKLTPTNQIDFGGQVTDNVIKYDFIQSDTINVLSKNDKGSTSTVYVQDQIKLLDNKLTIKPGLRLNYFSPTAKIYIEPRLVAGYALSDKIKLKGAIGRYYQFAKQINREDISQGSRNFWLLANESSLPVTQSDHIILGGSYETPNYLLDVEFYQKQNAGITEYTLRFVPQVRRGLTPQETFFTGTETVRGVDVLLQKKFGNLTGWIGYTLAEAVRNVATFSDRPYYSDQDVRHQLKFVATYKWRKWDLALTEIYSTGRPYTSIIGAYQVQLLDGSKRDFTLPSDKNANRLVPYSRMDLSAVYNTKWGSIGFSVFNVLDRQNVWYKRFQVVNDNGASALQVTNVTYLGITPNLTLSWKLR